MKNSEEFKNEVYRRADAEKKRIKRRRRAILTAIPCIALVLVGTLIASNYMFPKAEKASPEVNGEHGNVTGSASMSDEYDGVCAAPSDFGVEETKADGVAGSTKDDAIPLVSKCKSFFVGNAPEKQDYPSVMLIASKTQLNAYLSDKAYSNADFADYLNAEVSSQSDFFSQFSIVIVTTDSEYTADDAKLSNGTLNLKISRTSQAIGDEYCLAVTICCTGIESVNLETE